MSLSQWDPAAPLEAGVSLLEASAGTGKTWNIANLVLRLVTERGIPIDRVLVVTFTRAATAELKERIRRRIADGLAVVEGRLETSDPALLSLGERAAEESDPITWRRLRAAQESFDACLVSTIHGFCQRMLELHAFESGADFGLELMSDLTEVREAAVTDLLTRERWAHDPERYAFITEVAGCTPDGIHELAKAALSDRDMPVLPSGALLTVEQWREQVNGVAERWAELAPGLALAVDEAKKAKRFKPRQGTFTGAKADALVEAVNAWLEAPPLGSHPPAGDWTNHEKLAAYAAEGVAAFHHPALDCLVEWADLSARLASDLRASWVYSLREHVADQLRQRRALSYDDLLRGLAERLGPHAEPDERERLASAIGRRYDAALIDEFQDTDLHQWTVFREVFGRGGHYLYLIGDPKQAIYGFRGANIQVYLQAAGHSSSQRYTMTRNWRSDARFVASCGALLGREGIFGQAGIEYVQVDTPSRQPVDRIRPPLPFTHPDSAPLQLRWFDAELIGRGNSKEAPQGAAAAAVAASLADEVVELLEGGTMLLDDEGQERPVGPGDLAVLVRTGRQGKMVQDALLAARVPAVRSGKESVLASEAARDLLQWLLLLAAPRREGLQRTAAVTRLMGLPGDVLVGIDGGDEASLETWEDWLQRVGRQAARARDQGVMAALRMALFDQAVHERLLGEVGGERYLTDLLHVTELAHEVQQAQRLQLEGVAAWLVDERDQGSDSNDAAQLRLESDADALQILTVHGSKGLEFPIVFVPFDWTRRTKKPTALEPLVAPSASDPVQRVLDVRLGGPAGTASAAHREATLERVAEAERQERMRLLYVALTRARHRLVLCAGHASGAELTAVSEALFGSSSEPERTEALFTDGAEALWSALEERVAGWTQSGEPLVSVSRVEPAVGRIWSGGGSQPSSDLAVRRFDRASLDTAWRRHSYSALVRDRHQLGSSARDALHPQDHDSLTEALAEARPAGAALVSDPASESPVPLAEFPAGAQAGTALHEVLEVLDFQVAHPDAGSDAEATDAIAEVARRVLPRNGIDDDEAIDVLAHGLLAALRTPLGGPAGALRLCDLAPSDRLDELRFDLPVAGGSRAGSAGFERKVEPEALVAALAEGGVLSPADWLADLRAHPVPSLSGFLTGSIDLIFRDPAGRIHVADYKSNRLVKRGEPMVPSAFVTSALSAEMAAHDYFLQAHLYLLATHRFMRSRLGEAWDPGEQLGGVHYLFMRGMTGAQAGAGCFSATPSVSVLTQLDALFQNPAAKEAS